MAVVCPIGQIDGATIIYCDTVDLDIAIEAVTQYGAGQQRLACHGQFGGGAGGAASAVTHDDRPQAAIVARLHWRQRILRGGGANHVATVTLPLITEGRCAGGNHGKSDVAALGGRNAQWLGGNRRCA